MGAVCPIKDKNYYKILRALNYDESRVLAIYEAYRRIGQPVPSYEELVKNKIIRPEVINRLAPLENMYYFASDKLNKVVIALNDQIVNLNKRMGELKAQNPNHPDLVKIQTEIADIREKISNIRVSISKLNKNIRVIKNNYKGVLENQSILGYDQDSNPIVGLEVSDLDKFLSTVVANVRASAEIVKEMLSSSHLNSSSIIVARRFADTLISLASLEDNPLIRHEEMDRVKKSGIGIETIAYFNDLYRIGEEIRTKVNVVSKEIILNELRKSFGDVVPDNLEGFLKDVGDIASNLLSIGEYDNPITAHIHMLTKKASYESQVAIEEAFKRIDAIMEKIKGIDKNTLKELLVQEEVDSQTKEKYKVPKLRTRYSAEWYKIFSMFKRGLNAALIANDLTEAKKIVNSIKKNNIIINPLNLFDENGEIRNTAQAKLILDIIDQQELTKVHKETVLKELKAKALEYYKNRSDHELYLNTLHNNPVLVRTFMNEWEVTNNPGNIIETIQLIDSNSLKHNPYKDNFFNTYYVYALPRKYYILKDGTKRATTNYDERFNLIENNQNLYEAYTALEEIMIELRGFLPSEFRTGTTFNSIPFITRTLVDSLLDRGLSGIVPKFWENIINDITVDNDNQIVPFIAVNPDGTTTPRVKVKGLKFYETFIDNYINTKMQAYLLEKNIIKPADISMREFVSTLKDTEVTDFYRKTKIEANKEFVDKMDFDLETMLKLYSAAVLTYKSMTKVEDSIIAMRDFIANAKVHQTSPSGRIMADSRGNPVTKEKGLEHTLEAVDYHIRVMFGYEKSNAEMVTNKKVYAEDEKELLEELDKKIEELKHKRDINDISEADYVREVSELEARKATIGRKISVSNIVDVLNNYVRIKGLGWNPIAPIANINVAYFANMMEASRGVYLTPRELLMAYEHFFTHRRKIKGIFSKTARVQTIQSEIYNKVLHKQNSILHPMYLTESAEFFNQAPLVVGYMMATKVLVNGKEMSLYDLFDEDGNLKYNEENIKFADKKDQNIKFSVYLVKARAEWLVSRVHGNYSSESPIAANSKVLYRSLLVFRKWIINSFFNRLGDEQYQWIMNTTEKGRWRSYGTYYKEYGVLGGTFNLAFGLAKKILFVDSKFDKLNELDAANMRANIMELAFIGYIVMIGLMLKGLLKDKDDEDDEVTIYWIVFIMNILGRLDRDILLYADPDQFKSMLRDPIPVWALLVDFKDAVGAGIDLITGKPNDMSTKKWEKRVDSDIKKMRRMLPYGFNALDKIETYATNKNLYK